MTATALGTDQKGTGIHVMNTGDGDVELLSRAILNEAQEEAKELRTAGEAKAQAIRQQAQADADRECKEILRRAEEEAGRLRSQTTASAQLKARAQALEHRERLLHSVFEAASTQIEAAPQRKDYEAVIRDVVREAARQLKSSEAVVRSDGQTAKLLTSGMLEQIGKETGVHLVLGQPLENRTGVLLQTPDGHLQYDNTLQTRLARLQSTLRAAVYDILIGEAK